MRNFIIFLNMSLGGGLLGFLFCLVMFYYTKFTSTDLSAAGAWGMISPLFIIFGIGIGTIASIFFMKD